MVQAQDKQVRSLKRIQLEGDSGADPGHTVCTGACFGALWKSQEEGGKGIYAKVLPPEAENIQFFHHMNAI